MDFKFSPAEAGRPFGQRERGAGRGSEIKTPGRKKSSPAFGHTSPVGGFGTRRGASQRCPLPSYPLRFIYNFFPADATGNFGSKSSFWGHLPH